MTSLLRVEGVMLGTGGLIGGGGMGATEGGGPMCEGIGGIIMP
jgi:hypothetical protein